MIFYVYALTLFVNRDRMASNEQNNANFNVHINSKKSHDQVFSIIFSKVLLTEYFRARLMGSVRLFTFTDVCSVIYLHKCLFGYLPSQMSVRLFTFTNVPSHLPHDKIPMYYRKQSTNFI